MPGPRRGALPLALLVIAVLVTGIVIAVARQPADERVQPTPTAPVTPTDTIEPTETVTPTTEPTETVTPTTEPTETVTPTTEPTVGSPSPPVDQPPLAETGGAALPWLVGGALLVALSGALWRLSRNPSA